MEEGGTLPFFGSYIQDYILVELIANVAVVRGGYMYFLKQFRFELKLPG